MPQEITYGFNEADADDLLELILHPSTEYPEIRPRGGGRGDNRIEFAVDSATTISDTASPYDGMRELTVTIVGPDCDHASTMGNTSIKVYEHPDRNGNYCLTFGETDAALVDRKGWAYKGVFQDQSTGAPVGKQTPCHWVLDGLCCPPGV